MASPFRPAAPSIAAALVYAAAAITWTAAGHLLPGGRWLAVHLFTLGVLTNLVLTFSEHFARTLTRTPGERAGWWPLVTNAGVVAVLVGLPSATPWLVAIGASVVTAAVTAAWWRIRTMRRRAVGPRFAWVVRAYERAHGAFIHGAVLGALLGTGVLTGRWYGAARLAHLHLLVLGFAGLTLLATLVFFGPTLARTRIRPGAEVSAVRALRSGATAITVAGVALLLTGLGGPAATVARVTAGAALGVVAWAAATVCWPVARAAFHGPASAARPGVIAVAAWLPPLVAADALVVVLGAWRWLDVLGLTVLLAVLGQSVAMTLVHLAPMLRGRPVATVVRQRLDAAARWRAALTNLGVACWALGVVVEVPAVLRMGAALFVVSLVWTLVAATWPAPRLATQPR